MHCTSQGTVSVINSAPKLYWIIPTALGCTGLYRDVRDLREKVIDSRDWFSVYVAGFSYAMSISMTISNDPLDMGIPIFYLVSKWNSYGYQGCKLQVPEHLVPMWTIDELSIFPSPDFGTFHKVKQ